MLQIVPDIRRIYSNPEKVESDFPDFAYRHAIGFAKEREDLFTETALGYGVVSGVSDRLLEMKSSTVYAEYLSDANERLHAATNWTEDEAEEAALANYHSELKSYLIDVQLSRGYVRYCGAMLLQVEGWDPPQAEHAPFKEFMIDKLNSSIEEKHYLKIERPQKLSGSEFREQEIAQAQEQIKQTEKELSAAEHNDKVRKVWVRGLLAEFPEWQNRI